MEDEGFPALATNDSVSKVIAVDPNTGVDKNVLLDKTSSAYKTTEQSLRGRLPSKDSYAPTSSSSNPSTEVSASMNSAKAADEASKVAAEETRNPITKPGLDI